jgi:dethiobiotin synthetase
VRLVVCAGTHTEVGKTWVGAAVLASLRGRGRRVAARKPAQSFDPDDSQPLDADVLGNATGEPGDVVCSPVRTYPVPMAPPMAAAALGRPVPTLAELLAELRWPEAEVDVGWLETVGGPRSPIASDGDAVDLVTAVAPWKVVLVADAGLGTINAVRLSVAPFRELGHDPVVVLNRFDSTDDLHRRNAAWLHELGIPALLTATAVADLLDDLGPG